MTTINLPREPNEISTAASRVVQRYPTITFTTTNNRKTGRTVYTQHKERNARRVDYRKVSFAGTHGSLFPTNEADTLALDALTEA